MNYQDAKIIKDQLIATMDTTSDELNRLCTPHKGAMGLTSDVYRATVEYRDAKRAYDIAFQQVRTFNTWFNRTFKKEMREDRRARYAAIPVI